MIYVNVRQRIASVSGSPIIVCGNSDYTVSFDFDSEWGAYADKTAVFAFRKDGKRETIEVEFTGSSCAAPVLAGIDRVEIGVIAGQIRTTTPAIVPCALSISDIKSDAYTASNDVYNWIMEKLAVIDIPKLDDGEYFIVTSEGDYVTTAEGDFVIAKE